MADEVDERELVEADIVSLCECECGDSCSLTLTPENVVKPISCPKCDRKINVIAPIRALNKVIEYDRMAQEKPMAKAKNDQDIDMRQKFVEVAKVFQPLDEEHRKRLLRAIGELYGWNIDLV